MKSGKEEVENRVIDSRIASKSPKLTLITNVPSRSPTNTQNIKETVNRIPVSYQNAYQNQSKALNKLESNSSLGYSTTSIELQNAIAKNISSRSNSNQLGIISRKKDSKSTSVPQQISVNIKNSQGYNLVLENVKKTPFIQQAVINKLITLQNGDSYQGQFVAGLFHGKGIYIFKSNGFSYQGEFYQGKQHGFGNLTNLATQQRVYEGDWHKGVKHGEGRYTYGPDQYYNGQWVNDQKQGTGVYHFKGGFYNGSWLKNKRQGKGSLKLQNGTQFKGVFADNQFVRGFVRYPNGDEYSGQIKNNRRTGEGSYINAVAKQRYKGGWYNDKKNGRGTITYENGDQLSGVFTDDLLNQREVVTYKWRDGSIFNGWFTEGEPNKGTVSRPTGQKWQI